VASQDRNGVRGVAVLISYGAAEMELTTGAQLLIVDMARGAKTIRGNNAAPGMLIRRGHACLTSAPPVADIFFDELLKLGYISVAKNGSSALTGAGEDWYRKHVF